MSVRIDFLNPKLTYRRKYGGGVKQAIAKVIGIKHNIRPSVLDCTAGLGRDAFILASLGCEVIMCERNKDVYKALVEAMNKAEQNSETSKIIERMSLFNVDARDMFGTSEQFDVIYIDPMFPERKKSALVKKEMRDLREIVGEDSDAKDLINNAMKLNNKRVVVKMPTAHQPYKNQSLSIVGKANRFDVFLT